MCFEILQCLGTVINCLGVAEGHRFDAIRCEFEAADFASVDTESYLVSSAFVPRIFVALVVWYNIPSPDVAVDLMIVSRYTERITEIHSLSQQRNFLVIALPSSVEPIYVVLHAYPGVSTATPSSCSVTILLTYLSPLANDS